MTPDEQPHHPMTDPGLVPPTSRQQATKGTSVRYGMIWAALAVVIILGLAVVVILPKLVSSPGKTGSGAQTVEVSSTEIVQSRPSEQDIASGRRNAENSLQVFLKTRARLELANANAWGEPDWSVAISAAEEGDRLFGQRQFGMAQDAYTGALETLVSLESERDLRLEGAIHSAQQALQANDSDAATRFFEMALLIDPHNTVAQNGMQRALVRPKLLHLMATGSRAVGHDKLSVAQSAYREAVELDEAFAPASAALQRVSEQITDRAFQDAMSRALGALQADQIDVAEAALLEAASLKPDEQVVGTVRIQLEQTRQRLWLADQRLQATASEGSEDWAEAATIYRQVLVAVPKAAFATERLALAENRARLHQQLDHYLEQPARIYSDQPLANAEILIESAGVPPVAEIRLTEKIQRLRDLIAAAQTPQRVTMNSDGLTSVLIYHVGKLGQFNSRQLDLLPGTYTVVGSRPGYRDVRQTFSVRPGPDQPALDIRCGEKV